MAGIEIALATIVAAIAGAMLIAGIVAVVQGWLYAFRSRYTGSHTRWKAIDLLGVPTWIALELTWLALGIAVALLNALFAYQVAKTVRDWWHAGEQHKR